MEELRAGIAVRLTLALVNRRQIKGDDFEESPGGAMLLTESGRKAVITAYQQRKEEEVQRRALKQNVPVGLIPHIQARLLARHSSTRPCSFHSLNSKTFNGGPRRK